MTSLDTGTYGAKVQSWQEANPRDPLMRLMKENPNADRDDLQALFWEFLQTKAGKKYQFAVFVGWFANAWTAAHKPVAEESVVTARRSVQRENVERLKGEIKERATELVLLDMITPNGKALGDCTGKECGEIGGWYAKLAAKVGPKQKVSDALSEAQVRKLLAR